MSLCVYCHRRHMGNRAYQIGYKLCMLAEIKTLVKFICILSLGKVPNSTINNIIPCSLSVLSHWYVILSISSFFKSYLPPYRNPSHQPYFPSESYLIQMDQKEKMAPFPLQPLLQKVRPVHWRVICKENHHLLSLDKAESRAGSKASPCTEPAAFRNSGVLHTPQLISLAVERRSLSSLATLPESGGPLGTFLQAKQADEQSDLPPPLPCACSRRWQQGTNRKFVPYLPPLPPLKSLFVLLAVHGQGKSMLPRLLPGLACISKLWNGL